MDQNNHIIMWILSLTNWCIVHHAEIIRALVPDTIVRLGARVPLDNDSLVGRRGASGFTYFDHGAYMAFARVLVLPLPVGPSDHPQTHLHGGGGGALGGAGGGGGGAPWRMQLEPGPPPPSPLGLHLGAVPYTSWSPRRGPQGRRSSTTGSRADDGGGGEGDDLW